MSSESAFIHSLRRFATHPAARGLVDDVAVLEIGGEALVLTHDVLVEGVHFLPEADDADVAWKLVAVSLSDLAAKGAEPLGVMLGYTLGDHDARFAEGLEEVLLHYGVELLGGDTTGGGSPRGFGLTAIGRATHRPVPSRAGAQVGDALYVTGPLGGAMIGLEEMRRGGDPGVYARPMARLAEGEALAPYVTAMMDISDGLLLDASRLARASGTTLAIDSLTVPIAAPEERRREALRWGDDYELLFTIPADIVPPVPAYRIGMVEPSAGAPVMLDGKKLTEADRLGYEHD
jgi:thiamine-monophosphate kinase